MKFLKLAPDPDFQRSYSRFQQGNYRKARTEFEKRTREIPKHYPSYLAIGYTYLAENAPDLAEKYIRKSLELFSDYPQAHFARAYGLEMKQDYDGALVELNEVARLSPEYPSIQQNRNLMRLKATEKHINEGRRLSASDPTSAIEHLKKAMELAPEVAQTPVEIADILIGQDNCAEAVPFLDIAEEKSSGDPEIKNRLAECLVKLQDYDRALKVYGELSVLQPQDEEIQKKIENVQKMVFIRRLPEEYQAIPSTEQISRTQMASYIMLNLEFLDKYSPASSKIIVDILDHWAYTFILKTVNLGLIDIFPNRTFQPSLPVSRLELAKAASRILEILESYQQRNLPDSVAQVSIPDIATTNIFYAMVAKTLSAGVLSLDGDGRFHPSRAVSGSELMSVVNRLKELAE